MDSLDMQPVAVPDIEPIADPLDAGLVMHPDVKPVAVPDIEPVRDPMDVKPVTDHMDTSPRWETPGLCQSCVHAKQQQHIVRTKAPQSSTPFELVHSDLYGPMNHSIGGGQYYIIYIDDRRRYTEVYFLITKTAEEISAKFQHYQAWVETQGFHIKRFRSENRSGEYNNSIFLGLL